MTKTYDKPKVRPYRQQEFLYNMQTERPNPYITKKVSQEGVKQQPEGFKKAELPLEEGINYCQYCGAKIEKKANFCQQCGSRIRF